jgi:hypothetical protein
MPTDCLFDTGRLRRIAWLWLPVTVAALILHLWQQCSVSLTDGQGHPFGEDFINFWSGANVAVAGTPELAYDFLGFHAYEAAIVGPLSDYHYSYPPIAMLLMLPLAAFPFLPGYIVWTVAGPIVYGLVASRVWRVRGGLLLALAAPAVLVNAWSGQTGTWTAVLLGGGLWLLPGRPYVAGAVLALLAFKPQLALMIPVALLFGREWRALSTFVAIGAFLLLGTVALWGPGLWLLYTDHVAALRRVILEDGTGVWHRMASVFVMLRHMPLSVETSYVGQGLITLFACVLVAVAWCSRVSWDLRRAVLILATLIASPYMQDYDLVVASFVPPWLVVSSLDTHSRRQALWASVPLILTPLLTAPLAKATGIGLGCLLLVPALVVAAQLVRRQCQASHAPADEDEHRGNVVVATSPRT